MTRLPMLLATAVALICASSTLAQETKKEKMQVDPSGTWRWEYDSQGETIENALRLNLAKEGRVIGDFGAQNREEKVEVKKGQVKGDMLSLSFPIEMQGTEVVLNFSGKLKGDEIDGNVVAEVNGESHEYPWKPKRSVLAEDVIGTWEIRIEGPNGNVFEPTLKISQDGKKLKGEYESGLDAEFEVKDLRVEKNNLLFRVTTEYDGNTVRVDYKGRPYGDKVNGAVEYEVAGNAGEGEFSAKRKVEKKKETSEKAAE